MHLVLVSFGPGSGKIQARAEPPLRRGEGRSMIAAGIDVGHKTAKAVILDGGTLVARSSVVIAGGVSAAARAILDNVLTLAGMDRGAISRIFATGALREGVAWAAGHPTEMSCHARGAHWLFPGARTVIDMGAEGIRVMRCDARGDLMEFVLNDKCASGTGVFLEIVAEMLRVPLDEMGPLSLGASGGVALTSTCAVFAESEIVAQIHRGSSREEVLRAVNESVASKVVPLSMRVGVEPEVVLTGGVARNVGVVEALRRHLSSGLWVPQEPEIVGALGAALLARDSTRGNGLIQACGGRKGSGRASSAGQGGGLEELG